MENSIQTGSIKLTNLNGPLQIDAQAFDQKRKEQEKLEQALDSALDLAKEWNEEKRKIEEVFVYVADVHGREADGDRWAVWRKRYGLRVTERSGVREAHMGGYGISRSKADLDAQISMLSKYIGELQVTLAHFKKAKELLNA